jgi:nucleotide-binding universal stress UspA family protein
MKLLIATDGSRDAATATAGAVRLLRKGNLRADLLCVAPQMIRETVLAGSGVRSNRSRKALKERIARESHVMLQGIGGAFRAEGIAATPIVEFGSPADEIIRRAADYDMVVVGAHGRYERRQPGLGPVSSMVVQNSPRTVFVGRELVNDGPYRVLVALDGSDASFHALASLAAVFDVSSFDITLMHVIETPWVRLSLQESEDEHPVEPAELEDYRRELERELRLDSDLVIDRGLRLLEKWNVSATTIVEEGDPALEITSHADAGGYDLVVTGATGHSDVKHALMGSVSQKLAWNAPCSVLVVRR